ncbi:MAG: AAA family ATPase [Mycobacterium sp.]
MTNNDEGRPDGNGTASTRNVNDATRITDSGDGFSFADWVAGRPDAGKSAIDDWIDKPRPHSLVQRLTDRGHGDLLRQPANSDSAAIVAQFDRFFNGGKRAERPAITPAPIDTTDRDRAYATATLAEVAREVAATPEGARNHTLNAKALRAYRVADRAGVDRQVVTDTMTDAGRACGLDDREIAATLRSAAGGADHHGPAEIPDGDAYDHGDTTFHADPAATAADGNADAHSKAVNDRLGWLRADAEARRLFDDEQRTAIAYPAVRGLAALLAEPDEPTNYTVDQLAPTGGRTLIAAQYKAGKTTLTANLIQSLADGGQFLGQFTPAAGQRVALIDNELSPGRLRHWLRDQNIRNTASVADVVTLRGNVAAFNLLDDRCRATWAARFRDLGVTYLILDCLRPVLDALGLDEHREAGRLLVAFDALLADAGITDAAVIHHMGHGGERARGDSRLLDWPDAIWRIVRDKADNPDDPAAPRYFSAYGRDVDLPEGHLEYDPASRRLTYVTGGTRKTAKADAARPALIEILAGQALGDGLTQNAIRERLRDDHGVSFHVARATIAAALKDGTVVRVPGPNKSQLHFLNPSARSA